MTFSLVTKTASSLSFLGHPLCRACHMLQDVAHVGGHEARRRRYLARDGDLPTKLLCTTIISEPRLHSVNMEGFAG